MIEVRLHGRGGQGTVIASKLLACSSFKEGKYVQAFPAFGVERRGAPVAAFVRIDDKFIRVRNYIYEPDYVLVLDPTLVKEEGIVEGLKSGGLILLNFPGNPRDLPSLSPYRVATINASSIALKYRLGPPTSPIVNTAMIGAFARISGLMGMDSIRETIREEIPQRQEDNMLAAQEAYDKVVSGPSTPFGINSW